MEEIKQILKTAEEFLDRVASVIDREGRIVASTDAALEGSSDNAALAFFATDQAQGVADSRSYKRLNLVSGEDYVCAMDGTDHVSSTYLDLLSSWMGAALQDGKNEAEREVLLKNILLKNENNKLISSVTVIRLFRQLRTVFPFFR